MDTVHNRDIINLDFAVGPGKKGRGGRRVQQRRGPQHDLRRSERDDSLNRGSHMKPWFSYADGEAAPLKQSIPDITHIKKQNLRQGGALNQI